MKGVAFLVVLLGLACALGAAECERRVWTVDGVEREAWVFSPTNRTSPAPLVFAFHGHGGTMRHAARTFALHELWPEAIVVYPQGLPKPGLLTDPEGKRSGWQSAPGDQGDRDFRFVEAMRASLVGERPVDSRRIYAMGHSNGGGFTYLLWARSPEIFAAFAPVAAVLRPEFLPTTPRPVFLAAGKDDRLVKFSWQQHALTELRRINRADEGRAWDLDPRAESYPSANGAPVVLFVHDGDHAYPKAASAMIVDFFRNLTPTH